MVPPFTEAHIEPSPRRVRVLFGGKYVVDTQKAQLVWEHKYFPVYYFNLEDLSPKYLRQSAIPSKNNDAKTETYDIVVGDRTAKDAVTKFSTGDVAGLVKVDWKSMDAWFEEDEQIWNHPKDPYKRCDVLQSSRHVRIELNGVELANTRKPRLLFETGLGVRTYIPMTDCRVDLFEGSTHTTECPYKGVANYYSVRLPNGETAKDIVWWYRHPLVEVGNIRGFVAFYDEKVDVWVDGVKR